MAARSIWCSKQLHSNSNRQKHDKIGPIVLLPNPKLDHIIREYGIPIHHGLRHTNTSWLPAVLLYVMHTTTHIIHQIVVHTINYNFSSSEKQFIIAMTQKNQKRKEAMREGEGGERREEGGVGWTKSDGRWRTTSLHQACRSRRCRRQVVGGKEPRGGTEALSLTQTTWALSRNFSCLIRFP